MPTKLLILIVLCTPLWANGSLFRTSHPCCDFYANSATGSDSANGKTPATAFANAPGMTNCASTCAGVTLKGWQQVGLSGGGTWRETLTPGQSGIAGNPITFTSYGSGARPIISGADVLSSFTPESQTGLNFTDGSTDKPISWWYFEDASSPSLDGSTNGNTLTWTGATRSSQHVQGSYSLGVTSSSQHADRTFASQSANFPFKGATTAVTIGGSIFVAANATAFDQYLNYSNGSTQGIYIEAGGSAGQIRTNVYNSGGVHAITSDSTYAAGWHQVIVRWNGTNVAGAGANNEVSLWVDGVKQSTTQTITTVGLVTASTFRLQGGAASVSNYDEWFTFAAPLTDTEIGSLYSHGLDGSRNATTLYYATPGFTPNQVFSNGVRLTLAASKTAIATGQWWWDSGNSRVYLFDNPSGNTIDASNRNFSVNMNSQSYLAFSGLDLEKANQDAAGFPGASSNVTIQNSTLASAYYAGVYNAYHQEVQHITLTGDLITLNGGSGVKFQSTAHDLTISNCTITYNSQVQVDDGATLQYAGGVYIFGDDATLGGIVISGNTVSFNGKLPSGAYVTGTRGAGIWLDTVNPGSGNGALVYGNTINGSYIDQIRLEHTTYATVDYNVAYAGQGNGISLVDYTHVSGVNNNNVWNNTVYGNAAIGLVVAGSDTGDANTAVDNTVQNNLVISNTPNLRAEDGGQNDGTQGSGNIYTYNGFGVQSSSFIFWSPSNYSTYTLWEAATGNCGTTGCSHSMQADPLFTNAGTGDFTLQAGSPAIGAGVFINGVGTANPPNIGAK